MSNFASKRCKLCCTKAVENLPWPHSVVVDNDHYGDQKDNIREMIIVMISI